MATPPPKLQISKETYTNYNTKCFNERWIPPKKAAWKLPSNPGVWCTTNHQSRNLWQICAAYRKSPGCFVNYIEHKFQRAEVRGSARHEAFDTDGEKIIVTNSDTSRGCYEKQTRSRQDRINPPVGAPPSCFLFYS